MSMRVLVTGAAGFIGSSVCSLLLHRKHTVVGVDSFTPFYSEKIKQANVKSICGNGGGDRFAFHRLDLTRDDLKPLLGDIDAVIHLAGQPAVGPSFGPDFTGYLNHNVLATHRLLEASGQVKLFIYASSSSVYGKVRSPFREDAAVQPISPYGMTKLAGEQLCLIYAQQARVPAMAFRFFTVYGPRQRPDMAFTRLCKAALTGTAFPMHGTGKQERDFTYVDDVADLLERALGLGKPGMLLNLGGGSRTSLLSAISIVEGLSGRRVALDQRDAAIGDMPVTHADTHELIKVFGHRAETPVRDGLALQLDWVKAHLDLYP
jgi:nucleoside-diphosphate-sugar epimerase